jgi:trk system potassium uptake protein
MFEIGVVPVQVSPLVKRVSRPMANQRSTAWLHPTRLIIVAYLVAASVGALLLLLPVAVSGQSAGVGLDTAVFTATSALTVTGLAVVDTATEWSRFGQVVILGLIQLGGFGITTFASVFAVLVFRRLGLRARLATQLEQNQPDFGNLRSLVKRIAVFYVIVEVLGILVLSVAFWRSSADSFVSALWTGTFHAISAFNNAGFSTFTNNLVGYSGDVAVLAPVMLLVIIGGIGFPVVLEVVNTRWHYRRWSIHTRLTLFTTAALLVIATFGYAVLEWNNPGTFGTMDSGERALNSAFAAVTPRTAGFNTFDYGQSGPGAQFLTSILMLIGGGSASAAGGIKVTTFALLGFVIIAELRSDREVNAFGRRLSEATQRQALAVALLGVGSVALGTLAIAATSPSLAMGDVLFETVSAVGTVGLSTGITPELEPVSRLLMSVLMLLGRLGPVTFGVALVLRRRQLLLRYPEGRPLIG